MIHHHTNCRCIAVPAKDTMPKSDDRANEQPTEHPFNCPECGESLCSRVVLVHTDDLDLDGPSGLVFASVTVEGGFCCSHIDFAEPRQEEEFEPLPKGQPN